MTVVLSPRPAGRKARAALALAALPCATAVCAQTAPPTALDPVIVTATRTPQALSAVLGDVSVLDRAAIERSGASNAADLLARLPGIEFARNGGPGGTTSVFIRGSEARHTAVYIDGVRVDSQATGGAIWEQIPLDQIERIEVLRGPAAAVYGSDAVGGVVQFFTRRGSGPARPQAMLSAGRYGTVQAQAGVSGSGGALDYAVSASGGRSAGFDARTVAGANRDRDGWRRDGAQARVGLQLDPVHRVEGSLLASRLRAQYDGSPTDDDVARHTLRTGNLGWQARFSESATTRAQLGESRSTYESQPSYYRTETTLRNLSLQHEQRIGSQRLNLIVERREDRLLNPATAFAATLDGRRHQDGIALGWLGDVGDHAWQAHLRHDRDSEFGGKGTGSLGWGYRFAPQWRVSAAAATSFRAPTLYQRFSPYGNPRLVPESGRNVELALRWAEGDSSLGLSGWRNTVSQLINFGAPGPCVDSFGCYENVGRARYSGLTLAGATRLGGTSLRGSLDWHEPKNLDTGTVLVRRARRLATLGAEHRVGTWTAGAEVQAAGARWENAANTQRLGGYALVNLVASTELAPGLQLLGRVDNLGDKAYELARGFATPGRSGQVSLLWTMP
jgi:vitamin B12 transporter